jgi:hypothetical protein
MSFNFSREEKTMNGDVIILLSLLLGLLAYALIAKLYVMPRLRSLSRAEALTPILLFHSFRYMGLAFLVTGVVSPDLPDAFAEPAAYGDLVAALLALIALAALRLGSAVAIPLVWVFNLEGAIDLLYALFQGNQLGIASQLGGAFFIPAVAVPALLVSHFLVFQILLRRE